MLNKITMLVAAGALLALLTPSQAQAYGAAHVGYTHVGPNGVYHEGATVAGGGGAYGGAYHAGYTTGGASGGAYHAGYTTGGASYHYSPTTYYNSSVNYSNIR
jgi:hypothetical protein